MWSALTITAREGLEAALIIGIILAYLGMTGNRQGFKSIWIGTGLAVVFSLTAGLAIYVIAGEFKGRSEQIFEGIAMLTAAGVLTWMIFWMRKQSVHISSHLQNQVSAVLNKKSSWGLILLAFAAVAREGIETVLFLFADTRDTESPAMAVMGGVIGLTLAAGLGYAFYRGSSKINIRAFFWVTGLLLILFAGNMLSQGLHELQEAGFGPSMLGLVVSMLFLIVTLSLYLSPILKRWVSRFSPPGTVEVGLEQ